jgi:hypothetical protein
MTRTTTGNEKVKCKSITRNQPGETRDAPKSDDNPPLWLQNSKSEYPKAAVGTTKGRSAKVSRTLNHLDFPRVISQANGTPAIKSKAETIKPIKNEFEIELRALLIKDG